MRAIFSRNLSRLLSYQICRSSQSLYWNRFVLLSLDVRQNYVMNRRTRSQYERVVDVASVTLKTEKVSGNLVDSSERKEDVLASVTQAWVVKEEVENEPECPTPTSGGGNVSSRKDEESGHLTEEESSKDLRKDVGTKEELCEVLLVGKQTFGEMSASEGVEMANTEKEEMISLPKISPLKRPSSTGYSPPKKKKRKNPQLPKNPVQILHEMVQGLKFEVVDHQLTPSNDHIFTMEVQLGHHKFLGVGPNKKEAKKDAALKALQYLSNDGAMEHMQTPMPSLPFYPPETCDIDFTSDTPLESTDCDVHYINNPYGFPVHAPPMPPLEFPNTIVEEENVKKNKRKITSPEGKNPTMVLNELMPRFSCSVTSEPGNKMFVAETEIKSVNYKGSGRSKKQAKAALAIKVLRDHYGITSYQRPDQMPVTMEQEDDGNTEINIGRSPDMICDLVKEKFASLANNSSLRKWKVLAGVVMTRQKISEVTDGDVICVATGTKCIGGEYLTDTGTALNDCHAEVVCRRGVRRFLYKELLSHESKGDDSIFDTIPKGGYRLKPDVFFHLYINTSPCGDSRIFSPHEDTPEDNHPNRRARGQLRTKIEVGEGTIPVAQETAFPGGAQAWDAIVGGERLRTMSCSDKLARWNLVGMQGALLAMYIEPVYITSVVLGSLYHSSHFCRGVYTRVKEAIYAAAASEDVNVTDISTVVKEPFKLSLPVLASVSMSECREMSKAPNFCFHWTSGDAEPYKINCLTGKGDDDLVSNLCKREMVKLFHRLVAENELIPRVAIPENYASLSYGEIKACASDYQDMKKMLCKGFKAAGLGTWVSKPEEVDLFYFPNRQVEMV